MKWQFFKLSSLSTSTKFYYLFYHIYCLYDYIQLLLLLFPSMSWLVRPSVCLSLWTVMYKQSLFNWCCSWDFFWFVSFSNCITMFFFPNQPTNNNKKCHSLCLLNISHSLSLIHFLWTVKQTPCSCICVLLLLLVYACENGFRYAYEYV